jgi:hypothetical protein
MSHYEDLKARDLMALATDNKEAASVLSPVFQEQSFGCEASEMSKVSAAQ